VQEPTVTKNSNVGKIMLESTQEIITNCGSNIMYATLCWSIPSVNDCYIIVLLHHCIIVLLHHCIILPRF